MNEDFKISIDLTGVWELAIFVFVTFLILKLTNVICWSWLWVTSPLWITVGFWLAIFLVLVIIMVVSNLRN